jgi:hypothetical protein
MAFSTKFGLLEELSPQREISPEQSVADSAFVQPSQKSTFDTGVKHDSPSRTEATPTVRVGNSPRYETANAENPVCGNIDSCSLQSNGDNHTLKIRGWMFHISQDSPMIQFAVPNSSLILAHRTRRDDVAIQFPTKSNALLRGIQQYQTPYG